MEKINEETRKMLLLSDETLDEKSFKNDLIFGKIIFSRSKATVKIYKKEEKFGSVLTNNILDLFIGTRFYVSISFFTNNHFNPVGRCYKKRTIILFFNMRGKVFAECLKKDLEDLLEGVTNSVILYNPGCARKQLEFEFGFSGGKTY